MRVAFGLVALLVTVGVIAALWGVYHPTEPVRQGQRLQPRVEQFAGRGADREAAIDSFQVDPEYDGGRLRALRVTQVSAGGAMESFYGLRPGDAIVEYGQAGAMMAVGDETDADLVKALLHESYRYSQPIVVLRNGQRLTLPQAGAPAARPEEQFAGRGADREAAIDSFQVDPEYDGGRLRALRVTQVSAGGAMESFYGLRPGDAIVEYGQAGAMMAVGDETDADLVKALLHESYRYSQPIVVLRNGQRLTLPQAGAPAARPEGRDSLQRQLDAIQRIPTH